MLKIKYKKQNDRKGDKIMDKIMREKIGLCAKMLFFRMLTSISSYRFYLDDMGWKKID